MDHTHSHTNIFHTTQRGKQVQTPNLCSWIRGSDSELASPTEQPVKMTQLHTASSESELIHHLYFCAQKFRLNWPIKEPIALSCFEGYFSSQNRVARKFFSCSSQKVFVWFRCFFPFFSSFSSRSTLLLLSWRIRKQPSFQHEELVMKWSGSYGDIKK